jgi:SAM-dependent methyltransferase
VNYLFSQERTHGQNNLFRDLYIRQWIAALKKDSRLLDIGAGPMPYKPLVQSLGLDYHSHDFQKYEAVQGDPGLQSEEWPVYGHDYVCDITELEAKGFDYSICTEVLEHVPNPAAALRNIAQSVKPGGEILITLPFSSRMHQAPYWFSAGLSKYWFEYHAPLNSLEVTKVTIAGDFVDQMISELEQLLNPIKIGPARVGRLMIKILKRMETFLRSQLPKDLLESGGIGIYVELRKVA